MGAFIVAADPEDDLGGCGASPAATLKEKVNQENSSEKS